MTRTDIINKFIETRGYNNYLEIGTFNGENFKAVKARFKTGVDPIRRFAWQEPAEIIFAMTSDEYFSVEPPEWKKDIIFIDGLHTEEQVTKDIQNSLAWLAPGGVIILHDCNPPTELHARPEYTNEIAEWNGTVYKAWVNFRLSYFTNSYTVDTDWGVGVFDSTIWSHPLKPKVWEEGKKPSTDWANFEKNRKSLLNLISPEEFLKRVNESRPVHDGVQ